MCWEKFSYTSRGIRINSFSWKQYIVLLRKQILSHGKCGSHDHVPATGSRTDQWTQLLFCNPSFLCATATPPTSSSSQLLSSAGIAWVAYFWKMGHGGLLCWLASVPCCRPLPNLLWMARPSERLPPITPSSLLPGGQTPVVLCEPCQRLQFPPHFLSQVFPLIKSLASLS